MRIIGQYNGNDIRITDLHMSETYAGVLLYSNLEELNKRTIKEKIPENVERIFGEDRPVHIMNLEAIDYKKDLPLVTVIAWLECLRPLEDNSNEFGSHLFLVWFQEPNEDPFAMAAKHFQKFLWQDKAKDFMY